MSFNLSKYLIHNMIANRNKEQIAIELIVCYNKLEDSLFNLANKLYLLEYNAELNKDYNFKLFFTDIFNDDGYDDNRLVMIWEFLVSMFGNYKISPKYGWIEKEMLVDCANYICDICADVLVELDYDLSKYPLVEEYYKNKYDFRKE